MRGRGCRGFGCRVCFVHCVFCHYFSNSYSEICRTSAAANLDVQDRFHCGSPTKCCCLTPRLYFSGISVFYFNIIERPNFCSTTTDEHCQGQIVETVYKQKKERIHPIYSGKIVILLCWYVLYFKVLIKATIKSRCLSESDNHL